ncbi:snaclec agglucetin subunit alpha-1-like [Mytilus trossulus]|uniref:snaclec agglucetin subunit alpha-1-like n=1 Tax=Mytilus trossulus TaxID=6551 RepID=UPI0030078520
MSIPSEEYDSFYPQMMCLSSSFCYLGGYTNTPYAIPAGMLCAKHVLPAQVTLFIAYSLICTASSRNLGACYQGWTWLSDLCYIVEHTPLSWEDARERCIAIEGHLVQFEDIPQQTEVQKILFSNMNDDVWIGLKANKSGWTWTDSQSNQYNSFKDQTQDNGQCVMMDRRFWYETNCSNNHPFVCQTAPTECNIADEWLLTPSYHCIKAQQANTTWYKARKYCEKYNADLVLWDSNTELQMLNNISIRYNIDMI